MTYISMQFCVDRRGQRNSLSSKIETFSQTSVKLVTSAGQMPGEAVMLISSREPGAHI